jgi:hypothetical protein
VRLSAGDTDRLQSVFFIDGVGQAAAFAGAVLGLVGERRPSGSAIGAVAGTALAARLI